MRTHCRTEFEGCWISVSTEGLALAVVTGGSIRIAAMNSSGSTTASTNHIIRCRFLSEGTIIKLLRLSIEVFAQH